MALLTNINGKFSVSDAGAVTFNNAFTFPTADGTANYVLKTNGSGQLSWAPDNNDGDITGSGTANTVTKFTGAKTIGDGPITFSSNDSTFAGNVGVGGKTPAYGLSLAQGSSAGNKIAWTDVTTTFAASIYANSSTDKLTFATKSASNVETTALEIDISQNATFAGNVLLSGYLSATSTNIGTGATRWIGSDGTTSTWFLIRNFMF
jgi:hypothetical protein